MYKCDPKLWKLTFFMIYAWKGKRQHHNKGHTKCLSVNVLFTDDLNSRHRGDSIYKQKNSSGCCSSSYNSLFIYFYCKCTLKLGSQERQTRFSSFNMLHVFLQLSGLFTSLVVLIVLLLIGPLFYFLPKVCLFLQTWRKREKGGKCTHLALSLSPQAVLACINVTSLRQMFMQFQDLPELWRISKIDFVRPLTSRCFNGLFLWNHHHHSFRGCFF